jgi:hypothetical protein
MALCEGERKTNQLQCYGTLYQCTQCGNVGCVQNKDHACSNQGFTVLGRCYQCGATGQRQVLSGVADPVPRKTASTV